MCNIRWNVLMYKPLHSVQTTSGAVYRIQNISGLFGDSASILSSLVIKENLLLGI